MNGSIELIEGSLGSGKSAFAFERALDHLEEGGWVFTNIKHYPDRIALYFASKGLVFDQSRLTFLDGSVSDFHSRVARGDGETNVMVIIDEAHLDFNAHDWAIVNRDLLNFATLVRKFDINLLFLTQDKENLIKQFRRLVQVVWHCRNLRNLTLLGVVPCPIPVFARVRYNCMWGKKPEREFAQVTFRSYAWGLYDSDALLGPSAQKFSAMRTLRASPLPKCKPIKAPLLPHQKRLPWAEMSIAFLAALILSV